MSADSTNEPVGGERIGLDPRLAPGALPLVTEGSEVESAPRRTWFGLLIRRVARDPKALTGVALIGTIAVLCALAPLIGRYNPNTPDVALLNAAPSAAHWLGTDQLGRDLWARLLWGGRVSLPSGLEVVALSLLVGLPLGMLAGFGGRLVEEAIMRFIDLLLAVPGLLLAIAIVAVLGTGMKSVVIGLGIAGIPGYARVARASTLQLKRMEFVEAARSTGAGPVHILARHVAPNIVDPLIVLATLNLSGAILAAAALSFLGVGTQLPDADWGTLLSSGYENMFLSTGEVIFPAVVIVVAVLGINLLGDALVDALNPRGR